ncbi:hypothetical protein GCM10018987_08040 [Streptomyces cremeus]
MTGPGPLGAGRVSPLPAPSRNPAGPGFSCGCAVAGRARAAEPHLDTAPRPSEARGTARATRHKPRDERLGA